MSTIAERAIEATDLHFIEVHIAPWEGANGRRSYSVIGLTGEGRVYRYDAACDGWVPWSMRIVTECEHKR